MSHPPGHHALLDLSGIGRWLDPASVESLLRRAAAACGASVLSVHVHPFGPAHALTGVAVLAESHITLHCWPELDYIALDVFVCGACRPEPAIAVLVDGFAARRHAARVIERGLQQVEPA